jgi:signal transduction histidine kinase
MSETIPKPGAWGLSVARRLLRRVERGVGLKPPSLLRAVPSDCMGLVLDPSRIIESARPLRRLLGPIVDDGRQTMALIDWIRGCDAGLSTALTRLISRGEGFRRTARLAALGDVEVVGCPVGTVCLLSFRSVPIAPASQSRAEVVTSALETAPFPVWQTRDGEGVVWRNAAAMDLEPDSAAVQQTVLGDGTGLVIGRAADPRADEVLRRFVETVSETFAHLRVGLAIFDRERRLTLSNPALAEMFHVEPRWLAGRPTLRETLDRLREARQLPEQADYPAWRATLFTLFDSGATGAYEDVWDLPDGRSLQVVARPHPLGGIAFVFEDITEAVALQRWRSTAVEVRRATLDLLADGVAVFGADGHVRIANPAFLSQWGLEATEIGALHIAEIARRCGALCRDVALWDRVRAAVASGAGRSPWEARVALTDGRVMKARIAPMPDGSTLVALADITDAEQVATALRDRANALESAEQMRDTLVDHLSHRLRTPLNAVVGFSEMLAEGRAGSLTPLQATFVRHITTAAQQLVEGLDSLNDLASIHAAGVSGAMGAVALGPALRGTVRLLSRRADDHGLRLIMAPQTTEAVVWGDTVRVRQLVYSLVAEAVTAAEPGDCLEVGATAEGETVAIWCCGMSAPGASLAPTAGSGVSAEPLPSGGSRFIVRLPVRAIRAAS